MIKKIKNKICEKLGHKYWYTYFDEGIVPLKSYVCERCGHVNTMINFYAVLYD